MRVHCLYQCENPPGFLTAISRESENEAAKDLWASGKWYTSRNQDGGRGEEAEEEEEEGEEMKEMKVDEGEGEALGEKRGKTYMRRASTWSKNRKKILSLGR